MRSISTMASGAGELSALLGRYPRSMYPIAIFSVLEFHSAECKGQWKIWFPCILYFQCPLKIPRQSTVRNLRKIRNSILQSFFALSTLIWHALVLNHFLSAYFMGIMYVFVFLISITSMLLMLRIKNNPFITI